MGEDSDDDFDYELNLLAMQVQKYYYRGFFPIGIWVIWSLLDAKCYNLSNQDNAGNPPIVYASKCGSIILLRLLLYYKADINALSKLRETALIVACRNKRMRAIKLLLKRGAKTDLVDRTGYSALRWAVVHEHVDMVKLLLKYNASVTKDCYTGESALELARKGSTGRHAVILEEFEKKLVIERQELLVQLVERQKQEEIQAIKEHRRKREAKEKEGKTTAMTAEEEAIATPETNTQSSSVSKKEQKRRARGTPKMKVLSVDCARAVKHANGMHTGRDCSPMEVMPGNQLEDQEHESSAWIRVGAGKWQIKSHLQASGQPSTAVAASEITEVEPFAEDEASVRELLTSDGRWRAFLSKQMHAKPVRVQQPASQCHVQLTVEDLDCVSES